MEGVEEAFNRRVLAVDDEELIRRMYHKVLSSEIEESGDEVLIRQMQGLIEESPLQAAGLARQRFELTLASDGEEAVERVLDAVKRRAPYALIFLDMRMPPGIDGLEAARQIRAIDPEVKICFYTAYSDHSLEDINQVIGDEFILLNKPIRRDQLIQSARQACAAWNSAAYAALSNQALASISKEMEQEIEARKRSEAALRQARDEARAAGEAKEAFLASMSHELRTPLTSILGYNELVMGDQRLQGDLRQLLANSTLAGKTLLQLVNDILDMSKIRSGKFELNPQPFTLRELVEEVYEVMQMRSSEAGTCLSLQLECHPQQMLVGDPVRLTQILFNLLSNAIKFTPPGRAVRLVVECDQGCDQEADQDGESGQSIPLRLRVEDEGIGMSASVVRQLFAPFVQADASITREYGGTGLGLYISRQLVELMGGEIGVESREGEGSLFTVELPLRSSGRRAVAARQPQQGGQGVTVPMLKGRVLLAEDTLQIQHLTRMLIEQTGAEVEVACNGLEALQRGQAGRFDLILMDMQMPQMDGIEATRRLHDAGVDTPVFALTANVMEQDRIQFREAGCVGFLPKPIDRRKLYETLATFLQQQAGEAPASVSVGVLEVDEELVAMIPQEMWVDYYNYLSGALEELQQALEQGEWEQIRSIAHALKGMAAPYGHLQLSMQSARLQEEAVRAVQEAQQQGQHYVCALIDMEMPPGIDGVEAARQIRQIDSEIFICIVTAFTDQLYDDVDEVLKGNFTVVSKPFNKEELQELVAGYARTWNEQRQYLDEFE
jgi:two-component system sensor histidine kinase/response regulator